MDKFKKWLSRRSDSESQILKKNKNQRGFAPVEMLLTLKGPHNGRGSLMKGATSHLTGNNLIFWRFIDMDQ